MLISMYNFYMKKLCVLVKLEKSVQCYMQYTPGTAN